MMKALLLGCLALVCCAVAQSQQEKAPAAQASPQVLAPGYYPLAYEAPLPGSYSLARLGQASDGAVLDSDNRPRRLSELLDGYASILALMYLNCHDVNGCPLTELVLRQVQKRLSEQPEFAHRARILSLSFDPRRDTPQSLRAIQAAVAATAAPQWFYLTTAGATELEPILRDYQQTVLREYDDQGNETGIVSHVMRVFLIDPQGQIRNIYSTSFLHADTLVNDIKTVLLETDEAAPTQTSGPTDSGPQRAGDDKQGYESASYQTRSLALTTRTGQPADLPAHAHKPRAGLGPVPLPAHADLRAEAVDLGRRLFYDRRLSLNNTISCAMCHVPEQGFSSNELAAAIGFEGRSLRRNAPTLLNVAYLERLFHDGREFTLENQIWGPLLAVNEMANPAPGYILKKLESIDDYADAFERIFGDAGLSMENLGIALASYQRTLIAADSPFDRWYYQNDNNALDEDARRGFKLFSGKAGCVSCHTIAADQALFTDHRMHNTGIGYLRSMAPEPESTRVQLAPGVFVDVQQEFYQAAAETPEPDLGLYEITQDPADRWKYRTPTLRNIALTAPYMHDGSIATLEEVVAFYNAGGIANELLDPAIRPLGLSAAEQADLVAFLRALTSPEVTTLVLDAFAAPIGDTGRED